MIELELNQSVRPRWQGVMTEIWWHGTTWLHLQIVPRTAGQEELYG
jgi:hypothetical protein